jgi:hypothetical protein
MVRAFKISFVAFLIFAFSKGGIAQEDEILISEGPQFIISEGPHIILQEGQWVAKWVENGEKKSENNVTADFLNNEFQLGLDPFVFMSNFEYNPNPNQKYKGVSKITVISDIHGQYDLMVQLLKSHGVIDENLNWNYGNGHLVVNGDIMGRGKMVTEILWLVYKLENQAKRNRGRVHFLIGNHELMTMFNDLRYLNEKYQQAADIMGITVAEMYGATSVFGNWLRKLPAIVTINDLLFVHAGISKEMVDRKMKAGKVNRLFFDQISGFKPGNKKQMEDVEFLTSALGPTWYRGYFVDGEVYEKDIDYILNFFKTKTMIIGHTSQRSVSQLFGGRVYVVDSNIKEGKNGEILIIEDGVFYRGNLDGVKFRFPQ